MARGNPPERDVDSGELLEPLAALTEEFGVRCLVDVRLEGLDAFPDGEVAVVAFTEV